MIADFLHFSDRSYEFTKPTGPGSVQADEQASLGDFWNMPFKQRWAIRQAQADSEALTIPGKR